MAQSFRSARVFAMQLLYSMEITGGTAGDALPGVLESMPIHDEQKKYGIKLVDLVQANHEQLDATFRECSIHWDLERMARIDRIVLRIAAVELLYVPDVPMKVAVSEAVQIAIKYSTEASGSFVNGILTGFMQKHGMNLTLKPKEK